MLFNSLTYIVFMLIAVPMVVFGPKWLRNGTFLIGSLAFYGFWRFDFLALVLVCVFIDWYAGLVIADTTSQRARKTWLVVSMAMNLLILGFFKYTYFIAGTVHDLSVFVGSPLEFKVPSIILPLGISFYTFQSMSYTIDVFRRVQEPVRNYFKFLTFVMLWPQLVAGPILRTSEVIPQIEDYKKPTKGEFAYGLEEILQGLFKKLVIADTISPLVDAGFAIPAHQLGTLDVWTLAFAFGFQIYFDFSGYSQIALGSGRVMGFHFPRNFNWPYLATSPRDFWRRWHISLSTWIRDYLYLPLQGVKFRGTGKGHAKAKGEETTIAPVEASEARRTGALFLTWFIMGLWHGANWTFAIWGLWHAMMVLAHRLVAPIAKPLPSRVCAVLGWALTIGFAMLGWIWFRAQTVRDATTMVITAFDPSKLRIMAMRENTYLSTALVFVGFLIVAAAWKLNSKGLVPKAVRDVFIVASTGVMLFFVLLMLRQAQSFIYFQF
jgi:alginate O-acetyltransferase complex protein AlgI